MTKHNFLISNFIIAGVFFTTLTGCSTGSSISNMTSFSQQNNTSNNVINEKLIIPPSLRTPGDTDKTNYRSVKTNQRKPVTSRAKVSNKNYYIVVGTYTSQPQAFATFVRLSSIGLPGATMESRKAKSGQLLHMVRLGPYQKQVRIDEVTNSLTNDGLTQFKVVEN